MRKRARQRAIVSVVAVLLLVVLCALAVGYASMSNVSVMQSSNESRAAAARLQAEGGLSFLLQRLSAVHLPRDASLPEVLGIEANALGAMLNGTPNLAGATVSFDGNAVLIPGIATDSGRFTAALTADANCLWLSVTGAEGSARHTVRIACLKRSGSGGFFAYEVAAKGPISLTGNAQVRGANDPNEAKILTAANVAGNELTLNGNVRIDGNVSLTAPDGNFALVGNVSIGGISGANAYKNVILGADEPEFPQIDPTVFEDYATNLVGPGTPTNGNKTFTNIRILANTNPTFAGNITLRGIVFVETPNRVTFSGNLNLTGMVVTQDANSGATAENSIHFSGNTSTSGVENLPDTAEFQGLRDLPGAFILAPGFEVKFAGNFGTVNGCMAAEDFQFVGNAGGTVMGGVYSYGPGTLSLVGNSQLTINRNAYGEQPPGFVSNCQLEPDPDTYRE